jgi:hypothetical protein
MAPRIFGIRIDPSIAVQLIAPDLRLLVLLAANVRNGIGPQWDTNVTIAGPDCARRRRTLALNAFGSPQVVSPSCKRAGRKKTKGGKLHVRGFPAPETALAIALARRPWSTWVRRTSRKKAGRATRDCILIAQTGP